MNELRDRLRQEFKDKEYADAYLEEFLGAWVATQIKVIREQRGISQEHLAELAGMKQGRISVLENVNYGSWSIKTLARIAQALDVTLKVSFETVGSRIQDIVTFSRERLQRKSRAEELSEPDSVWAETLLIDWAPRAQPEQGAYLAANRRKEFRPTRALHQPRPTLYNIDGGAASAKYFPLQRQLKQGARNET